MKRFRIQVFPAYVINPRTVGSRKWVTFTHNQTLALLCTNWSIWQGTFGTCHHGCKNEMTFITCWGRRARGTRAPSLSSHSSIPICLPLVTSCVFIPFLVYFCSFLSADNPLFLCSLLFLLPFSPFPYHSSFTNLFTFNLMYAVIRCLLSRISWY